MTIHRLPRAEQGDARPVFDATAPFWPAVAFERARFDDADPRPYAPDLDLPYS